MTLPESATMMSAPNSDLVLSFLDPEQALGDLDLRTEWIRLLERVNPLNRLYASPTWFELRRRAHPEVEMWLCVMREGSGQIVGLCPIDAHPAVLKFDVASRILARLTVRSAVIMGGEAMLPPDPDVHRRLYEGILDRLPWADCISIDSLPCDGFAWQYLCEHGAAARRFLPYVSRGQVRVWRVLALGESYEQYLQAMKPKTRARLRQGARLLRKHGDGRLEVERFESEAQVDDFLIPALFVSTRSWQHRMLGPRTAALNSPDLVSLARATILRSYLLRCGNEPCAFVFGTQFQGVYQLMEMGFDESYGALGLSPGIVLLNLVIEDLFTHNSPRYLNFGTGDGTHKQRFANHEMSDAGVYLFRRNVSNRLKIASHRAFHAALRCVKQVVRRKRPVRGESDNEGTAPASDTSPS
jgi:hypothetical protein